MDRAGKIARLRLVLLLVVAAPPNCSLAEINPIGLVLSGGGAKGAYEVGVWQELQDAGLASNVTAISGTSIGAINAALFATRPDNAESLWIENAKDMFVLNMERIAKIGEEVLDAYQEAVKDASSTGHVVRTTMKAVGRRILMHAVKQYVKNTQSEGLMDSAQIAKVLGSGLPTIWAQDTPKVYVTATQIPHWCAKTWCVNDEPQERKIAMLQASSAVPEALSAVRIDDCFYVDGFLRDNTPISPILERHPEIKMIIVVFLNDEKHLDVRRIKRIRDVAKKAGVRLVEIMPAENIGGFCNWQAANVSAGRVKELIALGRKDAELELRKEGLVK